ncbi:hypothetical protein VLVyarbaL_00006 [Erwinia phage VyarbaL]|nr:hypothetical protein VLVyarbaL_00006 [Erwinia phage VyarbaL]
MALPVTGERPRSRKATVTALVAPLVLLSALEDVDDPINDLALSGKEAGATVYAVTEGTVKNPVTIELRIATGNMPGDPWVSNAVDSGSLEVGSDDISDAGATGKVLLKAATPADAKTSLGIKAEDIVDSGLNGRAVLRANTFDQMKNAMGYITRSDSPTTNSRAGVLLAARQSGVNLSSIADSASTATDVEGLLTDLNDLISKYNTLRTDVTSVNTNLNSVIVALKASGAIAT